MAVNGNRKIARTQVVTVGVDFSDASLHAAVVAAGLSLSHCVRDLHVVHVIQPDGMSALNEWAGGATIYRAAADRAQSELDDLCVSLEARYPVRALGHGRTGSPSWEIARVATDAGSQLVVLGKRSPSRDKGPSAWTAHEVERLAPCPVLSVSADEWPISEEDPRLHAALGGIEPHRSVRSSSDASGAADYILVVEDDRDVRQGLVEIMEGEGYQVVGCEDGRDALDRLHDASELPHLIVLDFVMPKVNGWMFLEECRNDPRLRAIPVLGMSASQRLIERSVVPEGVEELLAKPFQVETMLDSIQRHW